MVFQGRTQELIDLLEPQMLQASENLEFERAARFRDQIAGLDKLGMDQKVALPDDTISRDAIALARMIRPPAFSFFRSEPADWLADWDILPMLKLALPAKFSSAF